MYVTGIVSSTVSTGEELVLQALYRGLQEHFGEIFSSLNGS